MTKIYGIYGYRELNIHIPLGNGRNYIQREFTRGNPQQGAYYRPATYVSSDVAEQAMIESSPMFGRQIKLIRTCDDGDGAQTQPVQAVKPAVKVSRSSRGPVKVVTPAPTPTPAPAPVAEQADGSQSGDETEVHGEITTREELIPFLKARGAKAAVLLDNDKMAQFIADNNLSFPNLNM